MRRRQRYFDQAGNVEVSVSSMGFIGWLQLLFIGLKLTNYISWSWYWVLAPLWISSILGLSVILVLLVFGIVVVMTEGNKLGRKPPTKNDNDTVY
jgi:hypothetical protein